MPLDPLLRALHGAPEHRKVLIDVVGALRDERAAPVLRQALGDENPNVRASAAEGLAGLSAREAVPALQQALFADQDMVVALAALEGLVAHDVALPVQRLSPLLT